MTSTCIWTRQGIGLAQWHEMAGGNAFSASAESVGLFRANEDEVHLDWAGHRFENN